MRQHAKPAGPEPPTTRRQSVAELQARVAALETQNEALTAELVAAGEQQTAAAEVLQVINSSPGDLAPVFDAVLDKAMTLCGAAFGILLTYDGRDFRTGATRGLPPRYAEYLATTSDQPGPGAASPRLVRGEPLVHIADIRDSELDRSGDPYRRALADIGGARTILALPLRRDNAVLGTINFYRREVRLFTDKQIVLLRNFAAQAVVAMESARLIAETREALERQTATADILRVIASTPGDPSRALDTIAETAARIFGASNAGIRRLDGDVLRLISAAGPVAAVHRVKLADAPFDPRPVSADAWRKTASYTSTI